MSTQYFFQIIFAKDINKTAEFLDIYVIANSWILLNVKFLPNLLLKNL